MRLVVRALAFLALAGFLANGVANAATGLTVTSPGSTVTVPTGIVQIPLQAIGGVAPYTFSLGNSSSLPPGLAIRTDVPSFFNSATSGIIGVAPASDGGTPYTFTLNVSDSTPAGSGGPLTGTLTVTMHITSENFMDLNNLPDGIANSAYSYNLTVLNGNTPAVSLANSTSLPPGMTLTGATLGGTPNTPGVYNFQLQIVDGADTIVHGFNIKVAGPHITNSLPLPNAAPGLGYNQQLNAAGGSGSGYSYHLSGGNLPNGLSLSSSGLISGTVCGCIGATTSTFAVTVTDSTTPTALSYQQFLAIDVVAANQTLPSIGTTYLDDQTVGAPASLPVSAFGGLPPYTWSVTGLPTGMSFRSGAGTTDNINFGNLEIWGTPQAVGMNLVRITATDSNGVSVSQGLSLHISPLAFSQISGNLNGSFTFGTAINPAFVRRVIGGIAPYNSLLVVPGPASGISLGGSATGLTMSGTPAENGNFNYRIAATDSTSGTANILSKTVNDQVAPSGLQIFSNSFIGSFSTGSSINFGFNACCATGTLTWSISPSGNPLPIGLTLSGAGALTGSAATGSYDFFVQATDSASPSTPAIKHFTINFTPIVITTNSVPYGNVNVAYTGLQFAATGTSGSNITWFTNNAFLPPGMSLSSGGFLGGTPTSTGEYSFTVTVSDGTNSAGGTYSIAIFPPGGAPPVTITSNPNLGNYPRGDVEADLLARGGNGTFTWNLISGSLPPGLAIRSDFGNNGPNSQGAQAALIGVAQQAGQYSFSLQATSATSTATHAFTMTIGPMNLDDNFNLPDGFEGSAYIGSAATPGYTFAPITPAGTMMFTLNTGSNLPPGLSLSPTGGTISGTPATAGNYNFTIIASDGTNFVYRGYSLNVYKIKITTPTVLPNATQNQTYTQSLSATDSSGGTVTFTANGLPNGISLQNGVITTNGSSNGVTAGPSLYNVSITASDGANSYTENFSIDVVSANSQFMRIQLFNTSDAVEGDFYSSSIGVCCGGVGPFTWTVSGLPPGLNIRFAGAGIAGTNTGTPNSYVTPGNVEIYGVPTSDTLPDNQVTITVTDSVARTTSQTFSLHVSRLDETRGVPNGTIGASYTQVLRPIGGVPGYTVSLASGALPAGLSLQPTTIGGVNTAMLTGTPQESGNFTFALHYADSAGTPNTLDRFYYINIANSTDSNLQINTNSPLQPMVTGNSVNLTFNACCDQSNTYTWSVAGGALPSGLSLSSGGVLSGTASPGNAKYAFLVQVADSNNASNTALKQVTLQISSLKITTTSIPFGNFGAQYNGSASGLTLTATGGTAALMWSLLPGSTLPPGVTVSPAGVVSGTPLYTGQYQPTFVVTDGTYTTSAGFTLNVYAPGGGPALAITTNSNLGTSPIGYTQFELDATGGVGAYAWSLVSGSLPAGYALRTDLPSFFSANASAGIIGVGTGTQATGAGSATSTFTLQVTSGAQSVQKQFTLTIAQLDYKDPFLPDAFVGQQYNGSSSGYTMTAVNQAAAVTFSTTQATCTISFPTNCVPPGLSLSSSGVITGTATIAGAYSFNVQLNDGTSTVNRQYTINVYAIDITTAPMLLNATQGTAYASGSLAAVGGNGTLTWSASGLPNGFSINSATGVITAPSSFGSGPGNYSVQVTVTDQNSVSSVKRFSLNVIAIPAALPELTFGVINDATVGNPTWYDFGVSGGGVAPFTYSASGLPIGMSLRQPIATENNNDTAGNAEIWGVPSIVGSSNVTLTVTDANGASTSNTFTLNVSPLTQDSLPNGTLNQAYNQNLRIVGGTGPYSVTKTIQGALPDGLVRTGLNVAGTPVENGGFSVTYQYSDSAGTPNTLVRSDFINIGGPSFQINNGGNLGTIAEGSSYSNTLTANCCQGQITWSVSGNPTWLTLNSASGVLGGTAPSSLSSATTYTFLVEASANGGGNAFRYFTLVVTPLSFTGNSGSTNLPYGNVGTAYSQALTTSGATGTVTWTLNPGSYLPPGLSISGTTLSGTPSTPGQFSFTLTGTDTTNNTIVRTFNLNIYPAGSGPPLFLGTNQNPLFALGMQTIQLTASGGIPPYSYSLTPSATAVPGCRIQNGQPLPTNFPAGVTAGVLCVFATPGSYPTSIRVTDSASGAFDRPITINVSPLLIEIQSVLPTAYVNEPSYTFNPSGITNGVMATGGTGAYTFSATNLPPGLTIDGSTGIISGTPNTAGVYNPGITVGNASAAGTVTFSGFSLRVNPFQFTTTSILPQRPVNTAYNQTLTSTCSSSCTWSLASGSLPSGLSLTTSGNNGLISGTPTGTFDGSFTVQVASGAQTAQQVFSLNIAPTTITGLSITSTITTTPSIASQVSTGLFATGGTPPYNFTLLSGTLPAGVYLQNPGDQIGGNLAPGTQYLAGRPNTTGTYNFTIQVADSNAGGAVKATKAFTWTISPLNLSYTSLPLTAGTLLLNQAYSQQLLVVGGSGTYQGFTAGAALQTGLSLAPSTGTVAGTPINTGNVNSLITFTDTSATPNTATQNLNVTVNSNASSSVTLGGPAAGTVIPLGSPQTFTITPSGGTAPYTITPVGALPAGVLLESGNSLGSSFGTGTYGFQTLFSAPGTYTFTLMATDSSGTPIMGERTYTLVVPAFGPVLNNVTNPPNASILVPYSFQLYSFSTGTVTFGLAGGSVLPNGLTISSSGLISGTPAAGSGGVYSFTVTLSDGTNLATSTLTLKVTALNIGTGGLLPQAALNAPYGPAGAGVSLAATGGSGSTSWTIVSGGLPSGLTLNPSTGLISGTPDGNNGTGQFSFGVTASNTGGSVTKEFTIYLSLDNPGLLTYSSSLAAMPDAILGQNYQYNLSPSGGVAPYLWSIAGGSALPPGLNLLQLSALSGSGSPGITTIAGSPSSVNSYTFNLVLTDSTSATVTRTFTLSVTPVSITVNNPRNAVQGQAYSFQFEATGGTGPYSYALITNPSNSYGQESLPPGLTFNAGTGAIAGTPTGTGTYNFLLKVTDSTPGTHLTLTRALSISSANSFGTQVTSHSGSFPVNSYLNNGLTTSSNATYTWTVANVSPTPAAPIVNGLPPGLSLQNGSAVGNATQAGTYQFVLQATNTANPSDVASRTLTVVVTPITMTAPVENGLFGPSIPVATVGQSYSFQFAAAGGTRPYSFASVPTYPVPPGMTLSSTGLLSGTPTQSGVYTLRPQVTDANGLTDYNLAVSLVVVPMGGKPPLEARNAAYSTTASVGVPFAVPLDRFILPGVPPFTWSVAGGSVPPPGLSIVHGSNGVSDLLAGTPTAPGNYSFSLVVTDSASQTLTIPIGGLPVSPLSLSPMSLPSAIRGSGYSAALTVTGGTPPYSYQYDQGFAPPPGLSINNGVLSGTPTYAGVFPIGIAITDSANNTFVRDYEFSVDDAAGEAPSVTVAPNPVTILFITGSATTSTPVTVSSSSGSLPFNAALYGIAGASLTTTSGTTNGSTNINFGSLTAGSYSGFLGASAPNAVNAVDVAPVSITVLAPPPCAYTLAADTTSSPIGGNSGNINISAGPGCTWTASPDEPWITLTAATSGSANGVIPYSAASNGTGSARTGTVTITGSNGTVTFTINQFAAGCSFSINPSNVSATVAAGSATVNVVSSGSACPWTVSGLTGGLTADTTGGTGSGVVNITIPANTVASPQTLTATIATQTFTVNQPSAACNYTLSAATATFAPAGGSGSVNITAPSGCPITTVLGPSWLEVTSGGTGAATGGAQTVTYTADPNSTTQPRTGALTIGGQAFAVTEQALACSVSVDTSTLGSPFASGGGSGTIGITTNGSNCPWTAASNSSFATVTPANGYGNGTVNVTAASNAASTSSRNGSLTISGQTISFSQGGTTCSFSLRSSLSSMPSTGGLATVSVVAPSACTWTAAANAPWLSIVNSGTSGSADVTFSAAANAGANPQTGTLTVAGQTFTVNEAGAPCSFTLASSSSGVLAATAVGPLQVNFTASASGCTPAVTSYSNWITASDTFAGTSGTLTYSILENDSGNTRNGNIQVGDKVFSVVQTGTGCTYSINAYGLVVNHLGASGSVLGAADLGTCPNPPTGSTQPFVNVGTLTGTTSLYTLPFTVSTFVSSTTTIRVGSITFGGLTFYVKQSSY